MKTLDSVHVWIHFGRVEVILKSWNWFEYVWGSRLELILPLELIDL